MVKNLKSIHTNKNGKFFHLGFTNADLTLYINIISYNYIF